MKVNTIDRTSGEKAFDLFNTIFLLCAGMITLFPVLHILAGSFSDKNALVHQKVFLFPVGFQLTNYTLVLNNEIFWNCFKNTVFIVIAGTAINMVMTVFTAYPLSKTNLRGRKAYMLMVIISMIFVPPMIPTYLVVRQLGLLNTLWALIIPGAISSFNMILCMTFFRSIPEELYEAARIDGMPEFKIVWKIAVPLAMPIIVTLILFYAVGHWNAYGAALIYITKPNLRPLQAYLFNLISSYDSIGMENVPVTEIMSNVTPEGLKMASIIVATAPIVILYPFIQQYFIKGAMLGSLKD